MNTADHLKDFRFPPGTSGNPKGRPRKRPITTAYDDLMNSPVPIEVAHAMKMAPGSTWAAAIALAAARDALRHGGVLSRKDIREAIEGKAPMRIELTRNDERPPEFVVVYAVAVPGEREKPALPQNVVDVIESDGDSREE